MSPTPYVRLAAVLVRPVGAVGRDGRPVGPVVELLPAGSGRSAEVLRKALDDLRHAGR